MNAKIHLTLILIMIYGFAVCQQRLGLDLNTSGSSMYGNFSYQKVFSKNFIFQSSLFGGYLAHSAVINERTGFANGLQVISPFESINDDRVKNNETYELRSYELKGRGIGISCGVGVFHEFSVKHGIKFLLNGRFGYSWTKVHSQHFNANDAYDIEEFNTIMHAFSAISPEIYHTIRLGGRSTLLYGLKLPYHILIDRKNYDPINIKDIFYGLEPEFTFGLTYVIGKCDE